MSRESRSALELLRGVDEGRYLNLSLSSVPEDIRGSVTAFVYTVTEHRLTLDHYISRLAGRSDLQPSTRAILRLGLARLLYMTRVPDYAVVSDTVSLAGNRGEAGFCNAILRRALREPQLLTLPPRERNEVRYLSLRYSVAPDIIRTLRDSLGADTEAYLEACERKFPDALTVNTLRTTPDEVITELASEGIELAPSAISPASLVCLGGFSFSKHPPRGRWFMQGEASAFAVSLLAPVPGMTVADACSAPGGKSALAALLMQNRGSVHSFELHRSKLSAISSLAESLGIDIITPRAHNSTSPYSELVGKADRVICDVPCSGLGVLGKKPELRYRDISELSSLAELQYSILCASAQYLTVGGRLVYSTCTVRREENEDVVNRFLAQHDNYRAVSFELGAVSSADGSYTLLPHAHSTDGFFVSLIERRA